MALKPFLLAFRQACGRGFSFLGSVKICQLIFGLKGQMVSRPFLFWQTRRGGRDKGTWFQGGGTLVFSASLLFLAGVFQQETTREPCFRIGDASHLKKTRRIRTDAILPHGLFGCGSKHVSHNGTLVNGNMTKTCGPLVVKLTHTHLANPPSLHGFRSFAWCGPGCTSSLLPQRCSRCPGFFC